jgi:hypothetical protein
VLASDIEDRGHQAKEGTADPRRGEGLERFGCAGKLPQTIKGSSALGIRQQARMARAVPDERRRSDDIPSSCVNPHRSAILATQVQVNDVIDLGSADVGVASVCGERQALDGA